VRVEVERVLSRWPQLSANTYVDHPWPGWDGVSVDFWDKAGCGVAAVWPPLYAARHWLLSRPDGPLIRHMILGHALWTSWAGYSHWEPDDHSGRERHLHVTYWK
jgi:hypothetical protein